jgi:hypothetical protein
MGSVRQIISANRIFTTTIELTGVKPGNNAVGALTEVDGSDNPFQGDATMKVYNVVPMNNRFVVRGEVDWDSPLRIRVTVVFE